MSDIREKQLEMLKMLKMIDEICKNNDIKYTLVWGTALGVVRHKGFIPWDDDADIAMLWDDYKKFINVWDKENSDDNYFLQNYENDVKYPMLFSKLRSRNIRIKEKYFENIGVEEGIWIDIFPVVNISNKPFVRKCQYTAIKIGNFLNHKYYYLSNRLGIINEVYVI